MKAFMPISEDFCKKGKPAAKISHADGENFHWIWGKGKKGAAASNENVIAAYKERKEKIVPLGVSGTTVAVDWDDCVAAGACMSVCPVQTFQWYRTEKDIPAKKAIGQTFEGTGKTEQDERLDYTDKSDPIREHDCTNCLACVEACPQDAIIVEQANLEFHEKAAGTFVKMEGSGGPHSHD